MYPLSNNPAIKIQEVSCVPNTPNTIVSCIGALVRRKDGKILIVRCQKRASLPGCKYWLLTPQQQ